MIECKWSVDAFEPDGVKAFRRRYAEGRNLVVVPNPPDGLRKRFGDVSVRFVSLTPLPERLARH